MFDFIKNIGPTELIIIALILIVIFGSKVMIGLAKTGGETVKEVKKIKKEFVHSTDGNDNSTKN